MINRSLMGIVFPNVQDDLMSEMTAKRSMGSVPFMGRYRLIDFALSNMVNAGIHKVGVITKSNYQSLMDHLGSGIYWDLDRKSGGLFILPPFSQGQQNVYTGYVDALAGAITFLKNSTEKYVLLYDADVVCNFDIHKMLKYHIAKNAQITVAYKKGIIPKYHRDTTVMSFDEDRRVNCLKFSNAQNIECDYGLDITIMEREFLIELVEKATEMNLTSFYRQIFQPNINNYRLYGYEVEEYAAVMDSTESYVRITREVLNNREIRNSLFDKERPIFTKTRDDMPTVYGLECQVENSIIADGCKIEGTVINSVIFRGVNIEKGAIVKDSIIMQDAIVERDTELEYVTLDKKVKVTSCKTIKGAETYPLYVRKGAEV